MATNQEIKKVLAILGTAYPSSQIPEETSKLYVKMLADVPAVDLLTAAEAHIQDSEFFPKISELRSELISVPAGRLGLSGSKNVYPGCEESVVACERIHGRHMEKDLINGYRTRYCKHSCGYYVMKEEKHG